MCSVYTHNLNLNPYKSIYLGQNGPATEIRIALRVFVFCVRLNERACVQAASSKHCFRLCRFYAGESNSDAFTQ